MSKELMIVERPDFLEREGLDAPTALRLVYHCYGFLLPDEISKEEQTFIVAVQKGEAAPQPVTRDDYEAYTLDPVRRKAAGGVQKRVNLRRFTQQDNMLVFVFDPES